MKSITLGLALGLLGSVAAAQTPPSAPLFPAPAPAPKPPAIAPAAPAAQQNAQATPPSPETGQPAGPAQGSPPEGMVVETPNGYYLVRPGEPNPRRLDLGQARGQAGQGARMGQNDPSDEAAMDDAADEGLQPPPPPPGPRGPMPHRHPPEGKGARFRIRTPNLTLGMKCPDDEPIKACVDAVSQLLDKANVPAH